MNWYKITLLTGLTFCIMGGILTCAGRAAGGMNALATHQEQNSTSSSHKNMITKKKSEIDKFQNLQVNMKHLDLYIRTSKDNKYYMEYVLQQVNGKNPLTCQSTQDTLTLTEEIGKTASYYREIHLGIGTSLLGRHRTENYKNIVILYLPAQAVLRECEISLNKGDTEIKNLTADNLNCTLKSGDFSADKLTANNLNCTLKSGDFSADRLTVDAGKITMDGGDIDCRHTTLNQKLTMQSKEGDISIAIPSRILPKISVQAYTREGDIDAARKYKGKLTIDRKNDTRSYTANEGSFLPQLSIRTEDGDIELD